MIEISLHTVDYVLIGILLLLFAAQVYYYARYMAAPARKIRRSKKSEIDPQRSWPGVSVVLCAHNESDNLSQYLQSLLSQDYPKYEVIVVDDGSEDSTREVIENYMVQDDRLRMTFVPYGARIRSTKKLALTLAAKASQYDYLLLTDADCVPESKEWIKEMIAGFGSGEKIQVVLGFGPYFYEKGFVNRLVRYDTLFNGLHYLGAAICGHPYMGVGRNLAYRKDLFFSSGGFTHLMENKAGDDDLFVNRVATKDNTSVVVNRNSYTWSTAKKTMREWVLQKRRHLSVSPAYKEQTKLRLTLEPICRGLFYAMVLAMLILCPLSYFGILPLGLSPIVGMSAALLFLVRWIMQTAILNVSARRMGLHRFRMMTILGLDILLPLISLWMLAMPKKQTKW